jgi:hypothetical protein
MSIALRNIASLVNALPATATLSFPRSRLSADGAEFAPIATTEIESTATTSNYMLVRDEGEFVLFRKYRDGFWRVERQGKFTFASTDRFWGRFFGELTREKREREAQKGFHLGVRARWTNLAA